MVEHRAHERMPDRMPAEMRAEQDRTSELPSRKGGYERMAAEALRVAEPPAQAAAATAAAAEEMGAGMTRLMQETTRGLRTAMLMPMAPGGGFGELQEAFGEMVAGMMRNNIRLAQEMMRIYSPQDHLALVQKLMRHWTDAALESQSAMLRMARPGSEQSVRPLDGPAERPRAAR